MNLPLKILMKPSRLFSCGHETTISKLFRPPKIINVVPYCAMAFLCLFSFMWNVNLCGWWWVMSIFQWVKKLSALFI